MLEPFIIYENNKYIIENFPHLENDIPIISCINGNDNLIYNLYCDFIYKHKKISKIKINNNIDCIYYKNINDNLIFLNCYNKNINNKLNFITYLLSNIFIYKVDNILDNSSLDIIYHFFDFLPSIINKYKKNNLKLLILINNFKNKKIKDHNAYFINIINDWSNSIDKQIFIEYMNIIPIVILQQKNNNILEIKDKTFIIKNNSYTDTFKKIHDICTNNTEKNNYFTHKDKLINLINLINIDNIFTYSNKYIKIYPLIDISYIDNIDGSIDNYYIYTDRLEKINKLKKYTYEVKFKEISNEVKFEFFKTDFDELYKIVNEFKFLNKKKAEDNISIYVDEFNNKFSSLNKDMLSDGFYNIFMEKRKSLDIILDTVDLHIKNKYISIIYHEFIIISKQKKIIKDLNNSIIENIISLINKYDITQTYYDKFEEFINCFSNDSNFEELENIDLIIFNIKNKINNDINDILNANNKKFYLNITDFSINNDHLFCFNIKKYIKDPPDDFKQIIEISIESFFTKLGLLNCTININNFNYIKIITFNILDDFYYMTKYFYDDYFLDFILLFIDKQSKYLIINNYCLQFNYDFLSKKIDKNRFLSINKLIKEKFINKLLDYLYDKNLKCI